MSHDEAIKDGATERYVLDEMTDEERDVFEEHYFDCAVCAEDVKAAIAVRDGLAAERVAAVPMVVPFERPRRSIPAWLGAAASLFLGVLTMHFGFVAPLQTQLARVQQPRVLESYDLRSVRGEKQSAIFDRTAPALLNVEIDTSDDAPRYTISIINERGVTRPPLTVSAEQARHGLVPILIPGGTLNPGRYTIRVDGQSTSMNRFEVR